MHRPDHHGHRSLNGSELRLSHKPGSRSWPTVLHCFGWVGHGSVQVISVIITVFFTVCNMLVVKMLNKKIIERNFLTHRN